MWRWRTWGPHRLASRAASFSDGRWLRLLTATMETNIDWLCAGHCSALKAKVCRVRCTQGKELKIVLFVAIKILASSIQQNSNIRTEVSYTATFSFERLLPRLKRGNKNMKTERQCKRHSSASSNHGHFKLIIQAGVPRPRQLRGGFRFFNLRCND